MTWKERFIRKHTFAAKQQRSLRLHWAWPQRRAAGARRGWAWLNKAKRSAPQVEGWVLITGASQGLGRALAEECARRGMDLILVALPGSGLAQVAHWLRERFDVQVECVELDLTAEASPEALYRWIQARGVSVGALINNAGVGYNRRFEDSTLSENERCILLNNLALVKLTRLLLPELKRHAPGYLLNVASLAAFFPMPYMPVYAPSKAFILNFSLALRAELDPAQLSVSVLCPNGIRTNASTTEMIARGGLAARLTCQDPEPIARYAVRQMLARRAVIVPGGLNRLIGAAARFVPRATVYAVVSAYWGKTARPREAAPARPRPTVVLLGR